jgi:hypothetical protein
LWLNILEPILGDVDVMKKKNCGEASANALKVSKGI